MDRPERRSRVRACLLGAACGDGLGAYFEGSHRVDEEELDGWLGSAQPVRVTDDTVMMLVLAEHLAATVTAGNEMDEDALMRDFLQAWRDDPRRGYGAGTRRLFTRVAEGADWREARHSSFGGQGSYGDGAAMRVAPVGLLPRSLSGVADLARRSAEVTHTHRLGWQGAVLQACVVAVALGDDPGYPLDHLAFLNRARHQVTAHAYLAQLTRLQFLADHASPREVAARVGVNSTAMAAVPAALAAFLRYPDHPAAAIRFAILMGGDTDTIATMTGALVGARCGEAALPQGWLARLDVTARLRNAADALATAP